MLGNYWTQGNSAMWTRGKASTEIAIIAAPTRQLTDREREVGEGRSRDGKISTLSHLTSLFPDIVCRNRFASIELFATWHGSSLAHDVLSTRLLLLLHVRETVGGAADV